MTVLSITQEVLQQLNTNFHTSLLSTTDPRQLQMKTLLLAQSRFLRSQTRWPQQKRTYTFDLVSGRLQYPLPTDFYAFVYDAQYDSDAKLKLRRLNGDNEFSSELYAIPSGITPPAFRIFGPDGNISSGTSGGQFQITPTPTSSGETFAFEYYTKSLFYPAYWTAGEAGITLNTYRFSNGNVYKCTTAGTGICGSVPPSGTTTFDEGGGKPIWTYQDISYESVIANTDQSLWGDELMIAGVKWRYLEAKEQPYETAKAEHDALLAKEFAKFQIAAVGSFSRQGRSTVRPRGDRYGGFGV